MSYACAAMNQFFGYHAALLFCAASGFAMLKLGLSDVQALVGGALLTLGVTAYVLTWSRRSA